MKREAITFRNYSASDYDGCCALFEQNCPEFFAENERDEYQAFLASLPQAYEMVFLGGSLVAAFGFESDANSGRGRVFWIMVSPSAQGTGVGSRMMNRVIERARSERVVKIDIAASHMSAPFFTKFGASEVKVTRDGWGAGMHRVDMELSV